MDDSEEHAVLHKNQEVTAGWEESVEELVELEERSWLKVVDSRNGNLWDDVGHSVDDGVVEQESEELLKLW